MKPHWRLLLVAAAAATLSACGHSPPTQLFVLNSQPPAARTPYGGPPIQVRAVHLPPQFDRPDIISDSASGAVKTRTFAQWAAPVGELAQNTLTADLTARLPEGKVIFPDAPTPPGAVLLSVDVLEAHISGGGGTAQASWSVLTPGPRPGAPSAVTSHAARLSVEARGAGPAADAEALGRLLAMLADQIARNL